MNDVSVIIIVKGRRIALLNTLSGLERGHELPAEVVLVHMNETPCTLPEYSFPCSRHRLETQHPIPLAAGRNKGRSLAKHQRLIFLDVDCIPCPSLIASYGAAWDDNALLSGQIRYLSKTAPTKENFPGSLEALSVADPIRSGIESLPYELFWSLNFGCSQKVFDTIGGFDENFTGYGAEDTDFAFRAREKGIPIRNVGAKAYHQHHKSYSPPINHISDIVVNARRFYEKWKTWPMEGWLHTFTAMGLIKWEDNLIELLRFPTKEEMNCSLKR
ncbi:MAG: hypothetical protein JKY70_18390 [Mucilaginibacter sp.]|nr:hypothetical protein [Mucilaginibacter sp.]